MRAAAIGFTLRAVVAPAPSTRLIGRDAELERIRALVDGVAAGGGFALLIVGDAGLGKSRLANAAAAMGAAAGFDVRAGGAHHLEVEAPYAAVLDALDLRVSDLTADSGSVATRTMLEAWAVGAPRFLLAERLEERLEDAALRHPVILVLEDLHWADTESLCWLRRLAGRAGELHLGVLATTRPPLPGAVSGRALADWAGDRIDLAPLTPDAVGELAADVLGAPPGPRLADALAGAVGAPLLALALIDALQAAGALATNDGLVDVVSSTPALHAGAAVTARLEELDADTLRVLQVAAVLGPTLTVADLAAVLGRRAVDVMRALDDAAAAGILTTSEPGDIAFRHELYRDAMLAGLAPPALDALHLDVARTLASAGAPALDVAEHFARGARPGNREAVTWLERAAIEVVAHAPGTALRLLDIALRLCGARPPPELLMTRVQALAAAGHSAEAEALATSLLREGLAPDVEARLRRELALSLFVQGRAAECVDQMERVRLLATDPQRLGRVHAEVAFARLVGLDHAAARIAADTAIDEGRRTGDGAAIVGGTAVLCLMDLFSNEFASAVRLANDIERLAEQPNAVEAHIYQPWFAAALARLEADKLEDAARAVRQGRSVAERTGAAWAIPGYDALSAFAATRTGEFDDAHAVANATLDYLDGVDGFGVALWCHAFVALAAIHHGDNDAAGATLDVAEQQFASGRAQFGWEQVAFARAQWHERADRPEAAFDLLRMVWHAYSAVGMLAGRQDIAPMLVRLAVEAGEVAFTQELVTALADAAETTGSLAFRAEAERAASWATADPDRALGAVELSRKTPRRPATAAALEDAAALLVDARRRVEARACATHAADLWASFGADAEAERIATRFGLARPKAPRPRFGFDALTATERRVVDLVADGLSNAEIARRLYVSRRTVESHTSSAYRKVGLSSRVELAKAALQLRDA
jgi:DNA-binding CsgD family transcriptional regulator